MGQGFEKGVYFLEIPEYLLIPGKLEKYIKYRIVSENRLMKGLPGMSAIVSTLMPGIAESLLASEIKKYFAVYDEMNVDGFLNFRIKKARRIIDFAVYDIFKRCPAFSTNKLPPV